QRFAACRARLLNLQVPAAADAIGADSSKRGDLDASDLDQELAKIERRLGIEAVGARESAHEIETSDSLSSMPSYGSIGCCVSDGKMLSLAAAYPSEAGLPSVARPAAGILISLGTAVFVWYRRRRFRVN